MRKLEHLGLPSPSFWEVEVEGQRAVDEARLRPLPQVRLICQALAVDHFPRSLMMALEHLAVRRLLLIQAVLGLLGDLVGLGIPQIATRQLSQLC